MSLNQGVQLATGISSAVVTIFNAIVHDLDAAGAIDKDRLADQFEREALKAQENRAPELGTTDFVIFHLTLHGERIASNEPRLALRTT